MVDNGLQESNTKTHSPRRFGGYAAKSPRGNFVFSGILPHGTRVGELLTEVKAWWIEGDFAASREECLVRLKALAGA